VILATTTSTQDSGLLDVLIPHFERHTEYRVKPVAVGTGQALKMGLMGEADVLLVHAPKSEEAFMRTGAGVDRRLVMHNDFVIVGPGSDPAGIKGLHDTEEALGKIASSDSPFVSRGDDSGTHKKELELWAKTGIEPGGAWYIESGTGMGQTLRIASEKGGYTLADRGTYLALRDTLDLEVLVEKLPPLLNIYHVIGVNPERFPKVNAVGGRAFADFLVSPEAQRIIGEFGREKYGQPLFVPDAGKSEDQLGSDTQQPREAFALTETAHCDKGGNLVPANVLRRVYARADSIAPIGTDVGRSPIAAGTRRIGLPLDKP
jgi:tungstate transport system substrate-binding protein